MSAPRILAIDQGTTNTKAMLVEPSGRIVAQAAAPVASGYPRPGWAEQSAADIWTSVQTVIAAIVAQEPHGISGIAIANQRETLVVWDAATSQPICPAIIWQCRRTAETSAALHAVGHNDTVEAATGLAINPLFPAGKLAWVMAHVPQAALLLAQGRLRAGTVDSWLLWNLTRGASFATDHSNASRTQLFNTATLEWDVALADIFGAPTAALATPMPSDSLFGHTAATTALPAGIPIHAMMGDSHAALYGHGVRTPGVVKATYGTGSSLMALTPKRMLSRHGLSGTIAWSQGGKVAYAIEGNITVSAQAAAFAAQIMGVTVPALSDLAQTVPDAGGVTFVPALAGLGAPHWNDHANGAISGLTLGTHRAHIARATFEAIACQIVDVFAAMEQDCGQPLLGLLADGGASTNAFLMQLQADLLNRPVTRSDVAEVGALGAAAMAFSGMGIAVDPSASGQAFTSAMGQAERGDVLFKWQAAVARALA
ncbi:MAG: FGGY family carbohydrate kinase [Paracoccaceae bacterium]